MSGVDTHDELDAETASVPAGDAGRDSGLPVGILTEEAVKERSASLPWWRRPRQLRRQLAWTLVGSALASVLLIGVVNFVAARDLLDDGTQDQLVGIGQARARTIEEGVGRLLGQVSAVSGDLGVAIALEEFTAAFERLGSEELDDDQHAALEQFYADEVVEPFNAVTGESATVNDFLPDDPATRYLQYHYTVVPGVAGEESRSVIDAGDGSEWSAVHAELHESLDSAADALTVGDVLLVSIDGDVVYSTDKRVDIGTNMITGPYADSELGKLLADELTTVATGEALLSDVQIYLPADGAPVIFAAAAVKSDTAVIGAVAVEVPVEALNAITTSLGQWERVGLSSGESYVVSQTRLLASESRRWIEDPEGYLRAVDDDTTRGLIEALGSPVGVQQVDTTPVNEAFRGGQFSGTTSNYLGTSTFSYSTPINAAGVDWVVVVDIPLGDARQPLFDYAGRLGLVLAVLLPIAALIGLFLARRLTRRIPPVIEAATEIVAGERDPDIGDMGHDEFGDLARRLGNMAHRLGERERELAEEYEHRRELLLSVLPPRVVEATGEVGDGELADEATVIAVSVDMAPEELADDDERKADLLDQVAEAADAAAAGREIERIRASADGYLFLSGAGTPDDGVADAIGFARALSAAVADVRDRESHDIGLRVGVATGPVATGVLDSGSLTMGAWGLPVRQALAIVALGKEDEVLVDRSTAAAPAAEGELRSTTDIVDLDGRPMDLRSLS